MLLKILLGLFILIILLFIAAIHCCNTFIVWASVKAAEEEEHEHYSGFDFHCLGCKHISNPQDDEPCRRCVECDKYEVVEEGKKEAVN